MLTFLIETRGSHTGSGLKKELRPEGDNGPQELPATKAELRKTFPRAGQSLGFDLSSVMGILVNTVRESRGGLGPFHFPASWNA